MKLATREWVEKAEEGYVAATTLARPRKRPVWSAVCFHGQQCAEKYLKARLEEGGLPVPRTHDLDALLSHLLPLEPLWAALRPALQTLTDYAVDFRYPGHTALKRHAQRAMRDCRSVRREARMSLGLQV